MLVQDHLVAVSPRFHYRALLLILYEGIAFGEASHDIPNELQSSNVTEFGKNIVKVFFGCLFVKSCNKKCELRVTCYTFVGVVLGIHRSPYGPVMGLDVSAVDAASFKRVVDFCQSTPLVHFLIRAKKRNITKTAYNKIRPSFKTNIYNLRAGM